jgi:hypothetical protein
MYPLLNENLLDWILAITINILEETFMSLRGTLIEGLTLQIDILMETLLPLAEKTRVGMVFTPLNPWKQFHLTSPNWNGGERVEKHKYP